MFGLGGTRVLIRTDRAGQRTVSVKGPVGRRRAPDPLGAKVADFVRDVPVGRGTIRIERKRRGQARLIFSREFDEGLAQRIRNYVLSLG